MRRQIHPPSTYTKELGSIKLVSWKGNSSLALPSSGRKKAKGDVISPFDLERTLWKLTEWLAGGNKYNK